MGEGLGAGRQAAPASGIPWSHKLEGGWRLRAVCLPGGGANDRRTWRGSSANVPAHVLSALLQGPPRHPPRQAASKEQERGSETAAPFNVPTPGRGPGQRPCWTPADLGAHQEAAAGEPPGPRGPPRTGRHGSVPPFHRPPRPGPKSSARRPRSTPCCPAPGPGLLLPQRVQGKRWAPAGGLAPTARACPPLGLCVRLYMCYLCTYGWIAVCEFGMH